jgi:type VI secretion system protein ImpL
LWDRALLADAVGLAGPYQRFLEETLPRFPPRLRGTIDRIAREQMGRRLGDLVAQAQQARSFEELGAFDLELAVSREVEDLEQAAPLLAQLEELFSDLSLEPYRRDLTRVLAEQGDRLLADVDRLLDRYRLYLPATASLGAWEGQAPVAFAAFGVADEAGLERYLARQRGRIRELAFELAGPALTALAQARPTAYGRAHDRYDRWQRIAQELQVEGPESSVAALEEFIRGELQVTGVGECLARTAAVPTPIDLPRDFFLARREELRALLWQRCDHLAGIRAAAAWAENTELFRARLEERFPFSAAVAGRAGGREAASPEAVRVFLERVDRHRPLLATVPPGHPVFRGAGTQVRDFLADTAELAAFLAPYLAAKTDPALPAAGIEVEFRADRDRERGGNQILGWELALGTQRVSARDPEHRGVWRFGNPLELSLRWAKDAPALPLAAAGPGSGAAVESPAVRYAYADPWALVSFLRSHLAGRPAAPGDPFTLSFAVHTASPGASRAVVEPPSKADVRVFLRVRLFHPETQEPLPWPCFPRTVPSLGPPPPGAGSHWWCHGS